MSSESEPEPVSLEFIEDSYLPRIDDITTTPSLDELEVELELSPVGDLETELYLRNLTLDEIFYDVDSDYANTLELQAVETEFIASKLSNQSPSMSMAKRFRLKFFTKRTMRDVKVTFIDFSKPYLAKISNSDNYKRFLTIGHGAKDNTAHLSEPSSPAASVASAEIAAEYAALTLEEKEQRRAEWSQELARVEEEINTLRTVLASKTRHASDLRRKLGITVWKELTDDVNQGVKNLKESHVFQRTESVLKSTGEKTASVFGSITSGITSKLSQMKNSESMRSIEASVGSAYENVKTKVTSRSGSVSSFPDALDENNTSSGLNSPTDSLTK
ncbi:tumor protein D52 isoform X5 [Drosophila nasuta]|uniref:Tumor protein D52 isoform X5 n=1 Tax=Drosophila albomicans TaxID=7291 RepID=A0A6P8WGE1_DROAB|nr:tumor protein D52 isoform X5 [Drosophila albomicans]XP_060653784.1 tumor protein D52 isoform X5 [Drosophila nasuta]